MHSFMPPFYDKNPFLLFVFQDKPSLKLIFDNVANYSIAAGVILSGRFYNQFEQSHWPGWILIVIGMALVVLNCVQSWVLLLKMFYQFIDFTVEEMTSVRGRPQLTSFLKSLILLLPLLFFFPVGIWRLISIVLYELPVATK
jgi:hypothetical protein